MTRHLAGLGALLLLAAAILGCEASADADAGTATPQATPAAPTLARAALQAAPGSAATGSVAVTPGAEPGAAALTVEAGGLAPGAEYTVHLHAGSCAAPSASAGHLGTLAVDDDGRAQLRAITVGAGGGRLAPLTVELLGDGDHLVDVHAGDGRLVLCGEIPAIGAH